MFSYLQRISSAVSSVAVSRSPLCSIDQEIRQMKPLKTYARHVEIILMTMLMPCNFLLQKCVNII